MVALSGVVIAAVAQFIALMLTGAGHGWITPFWFSPALWLLMPIVLVRLRNRVPSKTGSPLPNVSLLLIALALDIALIIRTFAEGSDQFMNGSDYLMKVAAVDPPLVMTWILLWLSWQIGALFLLLRKT